jgi:antitoxin component YwqK of YwqJK toxin-antitoxin module
MNDTKSGLGASFYENGKMENIGYYKNDQLDTKRFNRKYLENGAIDYIT